MFSFLKKLDNKDHKPTFGALKILKSRLFNAEQERLRNERDTVRRGQIGHGDRAEKIRTYNFPQDRVTDHRLKQNWGQIMRITNGELEPIITALKANDA